MRLFTAISFPSEIVSELKALYSGPLQDKAHSWERIHLTLNFLGEVSEEHLDKIKNALAEFKSTPFSLQLSGLGTFPEEAPARVLWVGITPCPALLNLQRKLKATCLTLGISQEQRSYHPHVTLARFRNPLPTTVLKTYLQQHASFKTTEFLVTRFSLFSSTLNVDGSHYREEFGVTLKNIS